MKIKFPYFMCNNNTVIYCRPRLHISSYSVLFCIILFILYIKVSENRTTGVQMCQVKPSIKHQNINQTVDALEFNSNNNNNNASNSASSHKSVRGECVFGMAINLT